MDILLLSGYSSRRLLGLGLGSWILCDFRRDRRALNVGTSRVL